jgi:glycosyltransferase involved in cell wall biosynthesis
VTSASNRIRILRLANATALVTATVFEELFAEHLGAEFDIAFAPLDAWCRSVLHDSPEALRSAATARAFRDATAGVDFLCPSYEAVALLPLFAELRSFSGASVSLLIVAHSPAAWPFEWAVLSGLLAPGDRIVTPSWSARGAIGALAPSLLPFVRVVPHPVSSAGGSAHTARARGNHAAPRIVSLARLTPSKLLHRQLDAHALLRTHGRASPVLELAGSTVDALGRTLPYVLSLQARAKRLGLSETLRFPGVICGDAAKAQFLSGAAGLVNLSVTVEESFGKAPAEALAAGVPALITDWNGLPETVGSAGLAVPVSIVGDGLATVDVEPATLAAVTDRFLSSPPSAAMCLAEAHRFSPTVVRAGYRTVLTDACDERRAHPSHALRDDAACVMERGLLALAPLNQYTWGELLSVYRTGAVGALRRLIAGDDAVRAEALSGADRLRRLLLVATRVAMEHFYAGYSDSDSAIATVDLAASPHARCDGDARRTLCDRLAVAGKGSGPWRQRVACITELLDLGEPTALDAAASGLSALQRDGVDNVATRFLAVELSDARGERTEALRCALEHATMPLPGEHGAPRLHQLARLARRAGRPAAGVPALRAWLSRFPDAPDAGGVWLELSLLHAHGDHVQGADAVAVAGTLLGAVPAVLAVRTRIAKAIASGLGKTPLIPLAPAPGPELTAC